VLDVGCGRGEFLQLMKEAGVKARGIDADAESIAFCRSQGFEAEEADLFTFLSAVPPGSLDGLFSSQVVEHLPPHRLPDFIRLASQALMTGGVLAIETPNPECLAIFATHFYLDPTHTRPVPHQLLSFYCEEYGLGNIKVHTLSPAIETMPELADLPQAFRDRFFGGLDYALVAIKL
jgi:O-antigen chain-terminating methyltransferase